MTFGPTDDMRFFRWWNTDPVAGSGSREEDCWRAWRAALDATRLRAVPDCPLCCRPGDTVRCVRDDCPISPTDHAALVAAVERAAQVHGRDADVCISHGEMVHSHNHQQEAALLREAATLLRRVGPADGEPSPAVDGWLDEHAERMFWEFDAQRKQTGAERDAFKAVVRQALANERFVGKMMFRFGQAETGNG